MVSLEKFGRVYILTLLGDGEHRFDAESCEAIVDALDVVYNADDAGALVTTNEGKFFSNGLAMDYLTNKSSQRSRTDYQSMLAAMVNMNVPTIAAVCGHAAAGGFIFALAHDHRCMRSDRGYLYMSELDVGIRFPIGTMSIIRAALNSKSFKDTVLLARKLTADEALEAGIIDSVQETPAKTLEAAIALATQLSSRGWDRNLYRNVRLDMNPELLEDLLGRESLFKQHPSKL